MVSLRQACADTLHKNSLGPRKHHTFVQTACGSLCSNCSVKKPQLFCPKYDDYFCFNCFSDSPPSRTAPSLVQGVLVASQLLGVPVPHSPPKGDPQKQHVE